MTEDMVSLEASLGGLDFPASREDLVRRAQEQGADTAVLQALRSLPVEQVASPEDLREVLRRPA